MPSRSRASSPRGTAAPSRRPAQATLWEQGHHPGHLVVRAAVLAAVLVAGVEVLVAGDLGPVFDIAFVLVCLGAALWVRPKDFFAVGVLPPLLLLGVVVFLTFAQREAVARAGDPVAQAVISGLAHHALGLVVGYALALAALGLRQVALRNHGALRSKVARSRTTGPPTGREPVAAPPAATVPAQRGSDVDAEVSSRSPLQRHP